MKNSERVALVTAGTSGIGAAVAAAFAAQQMKVVISGRSKEKGERVAADMDASRVSFIAANALIQSDVEALIDAVVAKHGRLDVLVNNAGGSSGFAPVHELQDEAWMEAFHWNVSSAFWAIRRVLPHMLKQNYGRIINVSSVQGKQVNRPNASHYVMAKHAINGFTKAVAHEYGKAGITCNALCVGAVETDLMRTAGAQAAQAAGIGYEEYKQRYADLTKTGRLTTVEEVAGMALLLASDVGGGITGSIVNVDGGTCPY